MESLAATPISTAIPSPDQSLRHLLESEVSGKPEVVDAVLIGLAVAIAADGT